MAQNNSDLQAILSMKTIAVVGCSPNPDRPSHYVARYLQTAGYQVIPVNPGHAQLLGETCHPNLTAIRGAVDVVNIFRRPDEVFPVVRDAIKIGAKAVWMQDGVVHPAAFEAARKAGLLVVMDDCIMRRHQEFGGPFRKTITTC